MLISIDNIPNYQIALTLGNTLKEFGDSKTPLSYEVLKDSIVGNFNSNDDVDTDSIQVDEANIVDKIIVAYLDSIGVGEADVNDLLSQKDDFSGYTANVIADSVSKQFNDEDLTAMAYAFATKYDLDCVEVDEEEDNDESEPEVNADNINLDGVTPTEDQEKTISEMIAFSTDEEKDENIKTIKGLDIDTLKAYYKILLDKEKDVDNIWSIRNAVKTALEDKVLLDGATIDGMPPRKSGYKRKQVVKNGKKVWINKRLAGKRAKPLSPKQKQALMKARLKAHTGQAKLKRKKSSAKRKTYGL